VDQATEERRPTPDSRESPGRKGAGRKGAGEKSVVKSVGRVFEVLEAFNAVRQPMTAMQIAKRLDYPTSSTAAILKSMVALGYMNATRDRTYFPTVRLPVITRWIQGALYGDGHLMALLGDLHALTGETVVLGIQNDLDAQYIHLLPGTQPIMLNLPPGTRRPLCASGMGWALLSSLEDDQVRKLAERVNLRGMDAPVDIDALLATVRETRKRGYARSFGTVIAGSSIIAVPLPTVTADRPAAIGLGGPVDRLRSREAELAGILKSSIARHFALAADPAG